MGILELAILVALAVTVAIAMTLLRSGARGQRRAYPSCGRCAYDVSGSIGNVDRCPECGASFLEVGVRPPGRAPIQRRTMLIVVMVLTVVAGGMFLGIFGLRHTMSLEARAAQQAAIAQQQAALAQQQNAAKAEVSTDGEVDESAQSD